MPGGPSQPKLAVSPSCFVQTPTPNKNRTIYYIPHIQKQCEPGGPQCVTHWHWLDSPTKTSSTARCLRRSSRSHAVLVAAVASSSRAPSKTILGKTTKIGSMIRAHEQIRPEGRCGFG